jgi:hypothetical protein
MTAPFEDIATLQAEALEEQRQQRFDEFAKTVHQYFDIQADLLLRKHRDYGPQNIAAAPTGAINGLRVRMHDKMARINHLVDSGKDPENESLRDSFMDLANYAVIALLVLDGEWGKE